MFLTSTPKKAVVSKTDSIQCLICGEFLGTSERIAVFGRSQWDLRGTINKVLGGELQFSSEDSLYVCKRKCFSKLQKIEKMTLNVRCLEDELRGEVAKNAAVRMKRGLSQAPSQDVQDVPLSAPSMEEKSVKKALFSSAQSQTRFPSPVATVKRPTGLSPTVPTFSVVRYPTVRHSVVPVVVRAFPACGNMGNNFFPPSSQLCTPPQLPPNELGAEKRSLESKSNSDENPCVQVRTIAQLPF